MTAEDTQAADAWPKLRVDDWIPTRETLHMWTQIVGKIRLAQAPPLNHWWHVPLYVSARGLTTTSIPYGDRLFQIDRLLRFNRKFFPSWERRFVVYERRRDLPRVGIAALAAEAYPPFTGRERR